MYGELPASSPEQSLSCHQPVPWARATQDSMSAAPQLGLCLLKVWGCLLELVIHPTAGCKGEKWPSSAGWPQASPAPSAHPAVTLWDHMRPSVEDISCGGSCSSTPTKQLCQSAVADGELG